MKKIISTITLFAHSIFNPKKSIPIYLFWAFLLSLTFTNAGANALHFDASDDYVNVPFITPTSAMTIEAWVEITSADENVRTIISWSDGDGSHYFQIRSWSHLIYIEEVNNNGFVRRGSSVPGGDGWHHIAVVKTAASTNNVLLYIDGVLSGPDMTGGSFTGLDEVNIGALKRFNSYSNYYMGALDEIRVWNYDRCLEEIMAQKDCELTGTESGLELYYNFNQGTAGGDNTGETALDDISPNSKDGTFNNFTLDGATSNFIAATNGVTGACSAPAIGDINVMGMSMNIANFDDSPDVADGTDYGITPINTPATNTFKIENLGGADLEITAITLSNNTEFSLPAGLTLPMTIASTASFDLDVTFHAATAGLFESDLTITSDDCNEASYTFSLLGKDAPIDEDMLHFDGTDDYIDIPFFAIDFSSMTIEGWVYFDANNFNSRTALAWSGSDGSYAYTYLRGSTLYWEENDMNLSNSYSVNSIGGGWRHIAIVKKPSPTDNLLIYVDGDLKRTITTTTNLTNLDALTLGANQFNGNYSQYYSDAMDEIRIWNYDRCAEEILAQKDCELIGTEVGLQLYYDFNEGLTAGDNTALTSVTDGSPNSNEGTLNNFTLDGTTSNFIAATNGVRGACMSLALAEINVTGMGMDIQTGDDSPSVTDGTHFGIVAPNNSTMQTFVIENTGIADLTISEIQLDNTNQFSLPALSFPLVIEPSMSIDLEVTYAPQFSGINTTTLTITNNDCNELTYTFALKGSDCSGAYEISGVPNHYCPNETNGSIDISIVPAAGDPNYTVAWSNTETTEDLMNLGLGTYTVSVTEVAGQSCVTTKTFNIREHILPDYTAATLSINDICNNNFTSSTLNGLPTQYYESTALIENLGSGAIYEIADLNNDQEADLIYSESGALFWKQNMGGATFGAGVQIDASTLWAEVADMNGDLKPDIVSFSRNDGTVYWYENDGAGNFTRHTISAVQATNSITRLIVVDLDGQNGLDVFVGAAINSPFAMSWFENDGSGTFTGHNILENGEPSTDSQPLVSLDFDRDGDIDFLYVDRISISGDLYEDLILLTNDGLQNFTAQNIARAFDTEYFDNMNIHDVNQDGWDDIVYAYDAEFGNNEVQWIENEEGSFNYVARQRLYSNGSLIHGTSYLDWDGDGKLDILVGLQNRLILLNRQNASSFETIELFRNSGSIINYRDVIPYDFDGDGGIEIVTAGAGTSMVFFQDLAYIKSPFDFDYNFNGGSNLLFENATVSVSSGRAFPQITDIEEAGMTTMNITEITDATGCPVSANMSDDFNRIAFDVTSVITPMDECTVNNDGAIDITATVMGSTETLTYQWFDPALSTTDEDRTGLSDGSYRVRVGAGSCFNFTTHIVGDVVAPVAKAKDYTIGLNGATDVTVTGADIDDTSTDNCNIATYECMLPNGDPCTFTTTGDYDVVLKVTDDAGLENTAPATVTVEASSLAIDARSFTAQVIQQESHLQWSVVSSTDLSHFVVEHSVDAKSWQAIGEVIVNAENNNQNTYQFIDISPNKGINYYRVQEVTLAGKMSYSIIKKLWLENAVATLRVFPNPTNSELTITATDVVESQTTLTLFDLVGKVVYQRHLYPNSTNLQTTINLFNLPQGLYTLQLYNEGQARAQRVIKQ